MIVAHIESPQLVATVKGASMVYTDVGFLLLRVKISNRTPPKLDLQLRDKSHQPNTEFMLCATQVNSSYMFCCAFVRLKSAGSTQICGDVVPSSKFLLSV